MNDKLSYATETYDRVTTLIGNCDSKASFILAFTGVLIPLAATNERLIKGVETLIVNFIAYWANGDGVFSILATIMFLSLCASIVFLGRSVILEIHCLTARLTDNENSLAEFNL